MAFFHGVKTSEVPTSLLSPVTVDSAITFAIGTAPKHLANNPAKTNEPVLCYQLSEYAEKFGSTSDFDNFTLAEVASSHFQLFRVAPVVFVNVLDEKKHFSEHSITTALSSDTILTLTQNIDLSSIEITSTGEEKISLIENADFEVHIDTDTLTTEINIISNIALGDYEIDVEYTQTDSTVTNLVLNETDFPYSIPFGSTNVMISARKTVTNILAEGKDFTAKYDSNGTAEVSIIDENLIFNNYGTVKWHEIDPSKVTAADIIGGVDSEGNRTGLELLQEVYAKFRVVPSIVIAPKFSTDPAVAAAMKAAVKDISGVFKGVAIVDIPADVPYTQAAEWKNQKNLVDESLIVCWPKVSLSGVQYHLSTQLAALMALTDSETTTETPHVSPSNKNLQIDASVIKNGEEKLLTLTQANYLNSNGITTVLNFSQGWVAWGNYTSIYPSSTDPRENFIPVRRMFNFINNTLVLTYFQRVDFPLTQRLLETIQDSVNIWMNGLTAAEVIVGGRCEILASENPTTDLIAGIVKFHIFITPPVPAQTLEFILEYDTNYIAELVAS